MLIPTLVNTDPCVWVAEGGNFWKSIFTAVQIQLKTEKFKFKQ